MWIFAGIIVAFLIWFIFKMSIVSLYILLLFGIIVGSVPLLIRRTREKRKTSRS